MLAAAASVAARMTLAEEFVTDALGPRVALGVNDEEFTAVARPPGWVRVSGFAKALRAVALVMSEVILPGAVVPIGIVPALIGVSLLTCLVLTTGRPVV